MKSKGTIISLGFFIYTLFTQESAAGLIKFFNLLERRLFEGGAYSGAAFI